jgi:hypothetical protein
VGIPDHPVPYGGFQPGQEVEEKAFYCDQKGQCFLHDTSRAAADMIRDTLNEEGKNGWELVQFGYHQNELMCGWKRAAEVL